MPRKKRSTKAKFEFLGFVNLDFNDEEKTVVRKWLTAFQPDPADSIAVLAEAKYKISIAYVESDEAYQFSATCKDLGSGYCGYVFTLRHVCIASGLGILRYVYDSLLKDSLYVHKEKSTQHDW